MRYKKEFLGELLGTFILVLFGCSSIAVSILFDGHSGLFQVALIWGIGVTLAIYLTRHLSCAHINPAVTISMAIAKKMDIRKLPVYLLAQFIGAFIAGFAVYLLFAPSISSYELAHHIVRGTADSKATAMIFGEYYPNPAFTAVVSMPHAMVAEAFGTFLLLIMVFALTEGCNVGRPDNALAPVFIGLTVTLIICLIAPLTQAGLNPARDFSPRIVTWITGWGDAAFPDTHGGYFFVYILSPIIGGVAASLFFMKIIEPAMKKTKEPCC